MPDTLNRQRGFKSAGSDTGDGAAGDNRHRVIGLSAGVDDESCRQGAISTALAVRLAANGAVFIFTSRKLADQPNADNTSGMCQHQR